MADSLRDLIADVLRDFYEETRGYHSLEDEADALLADPRIAAIIDLAASHHLANGSVSITPEVRALLADWRAQR